ncbi:hypothetical protein [Rhodococcus sp. H29-C3]|uniref:hypothetical protein n=1 Tax=Rhodococcus sp. H29-C3 TaxID=3046307 RepID=UPI0024B91EEF|nr:hypothetical protein [Rhodococcus sp. H29-C3]MDJ0363413.1 hypothetical protein [Rhodococcus sp. H29-C3]
MATTLPIPPTALSEARSTSAPRTGRDQIAPQPDGYYDPGTIEQMMSGSPTVHFHGEDNRTTRYSFAQLPCSELHDTLAVAWATRIGPVGGLRTRSGADNGWNTLKRFLKFLGDHPQPPTRLDRVTVVHLEGYHAQELARTTPPQASREITALKAILRHVPGTELDSAVGEYVSRKRESPHPQQPKTSAVIGYSDREFMAIMAAARSDVAAIRARLRSSQQLLESYALQPHTLSAAERERGAKLSEMAATGVVPPPLRPSAVSGSVIDLAGWVTKAAELFVTTQDLLPLLVLGVGLSGRNGETIKELAHDHRVLDDRAVAVNILKRRRGKARTRETVHWEGSTKDAELRTPGGFFLLLHELTSGSRAFSNSRRVWSIWTRDNFRGPKDFIGTRAAAHGHIDPFELEVSRWLEHRKWISRHSLTADDSAPLVLSMNRLKTTVEVRRTRAVGGHLRSASRTNTPDVSFVHYLRSDPRIRDWADEVLTEALHEAEHNAHAFRGRILGASESAALTSNPAGIAAELGVSIDQIQRAVNGELDTLVSSCLDFEHSPFVRSGPCAVSFLTCLRCPNALVTERHLPHLFALLDWLQRELDRRGIDDWVGHHGSTWLIITRLILPKFTVPQQERGRAEKPVNMPTDLLDGLRELA